MFTLLVPLALVAALALLLIFMRTSQTRSEIDWEACPCGCSIPMSHPSYARLHGDMTPVPGEIRWDWEAEDRAAIWPKLRCPGCKRLPTLPYMPAKYIACACGHRGLHPLSNLWLTHDPPTWEWPARP